MKQQNIILFLIVAFVFTNMANGFAQTDSKPVTLDAVVVTAEKSDSDFQTGDVDTEQTPAFFSVIKREQFEGKMENLSEIIEKEAGVQIRQSGGLGSFSTVSLRGSSSEQVVIYMDGVPLNEASGGGVNLANISLSDIASVEIYRGITPVNFGKASVGGVINIKTLRAEKGLHASGGAGYGSFNARSLGAFINHKPVSYKCVKPARSRICLRAGAGASPESVIISPLGVKGACRGWNCPRERLMCCSGDSLLQNSSEKNIKNEAKGGAFNE